MDGKELDELSQPVRKAIEKLTTWVTPEMRSFDGSLMVFLIAEPWRRSRRRSPRRVDGNYSPDLYTQRTIRNRLVHGSWTSLGSFISSTYVQLPLFRSR